MELNGQVLDMPFADFAAYLFAAHMFQWELLLALILGSLFVSPFGAFTTRIIHHKILHYAVAVIITTLGIWTLFKTWF
jgi:uncharacterized membrane protein YfcA